MKNRLPANTFINSAMTFVREAAMDVLATIFPRTCHICGGQLADGEQFVCGTCLASLPRTGFHRQKMNPVEQRFAGLFPFSRATSHFFYSRDSSMATLLQDMKYRGFSEIGRMLGKTIGSELAVTPFFDGIDCIMPVPMHFIKKAKRGYNQTDLIAAGLGEATGLPVSGKLVAVRSHRTQTSMTLEQRRINTRSLFELRNPEDFAGKGILLIDDVCTTGSTLTSAAEAVIRDCPTATIAILTVCATF